MAGLGVGLEHPHPPLGVDDPVVLGELLERLSRAGVAPYYVFQNRPVAGNAGFVVPLGRAHAVVEATKALTSGLGKRVRLAMSHASGKIEVLAVEGDRIYLKYHEARNPADYGRLASQRYSTVTLLARLRGLSTSQPRLTAA